MNSKNQQKDTKQKRFILGLTFCLCLLMFFGLMSISSKHFVTYQIELPKRLSLPIGYLPNH